MSVETIIRMIYMTPVFNVMSTVMLFCGLWQNLRGRPSAEQIHGRNPSLVTLNWGGLAALDNEMLMLMTMTKTCM